MEKQQTAKKSKNPAGPKPKRQKSPTSTNNMRCFVGTWPKEVIGLLGRPYVLALGAILRNNPFITDEQVKWCINKDNVVYLDLTVLGRALRLIDGAVNNFDASDWLKKKGTIKLLGVKGPLCAQHCFQLKGEGQNVKPIWYIQVNPGLQDLLIWDCPTKKIINQIAHQKLMYARSFFKMPGELNTKAILNNPVCAEEAAEAMMWLNPPEPEPTPEPPITRALFPADVPDTPLVSIFDSMPMEEFLPESLVVAEWGSVETDMDEETRKLLADIEVLESNTVMPEFQVIGEDPFVSGFLESQSFV